jgi:uncharacterized protein (DUF58 family)
MGFSPQGALAPHFDRWLQRRFPPAEQLQLGQRRIFIVPTRAGLVFIGLLSLLLITAINYQNNAIYFLAFLLSGQFAVALFATYFNLAGLSLRRGGHSPGFAGDTLSFRVHLQSGQGRRHIGLRLGWPGQPRVRAELDAWGEVVIELYHSAERRGLLSPGRLRVETCYPFGLFRAWSWPDLGVACWVYPQPRRVPVLPVTEQNLGSAGRSSPMPSEEFTNIRPWRPSDPPRQVLWKAFAKQQPLMTMEYGQALQREVWIDEVLAGGADLEERLSALCYAVLQLSRDDARYGLRLGGREIAPARGEEHRRQLLEQLARYRIQGSPS